MMKIYIALTMFAIFHGAASVPCPTTVDTCTSGCDSTDDCRNCQYTCDCELNSQPPCPEAPFCGTFDAGADGCGGSLGTLDCVSNCIDPEICYEDLCCTPEESPSCPTAAVGGSCANIDYDDGCGTTAVIDCSGNCIENDACIDGVCSCSPITPPSCPTPSAGGSCADLPSESDGCYGTTDDVDCSMNCITGETCVDDVCTPEGCPDTCIVDIDGTIFTGFCGDTQPANTIPAGPCSDECGTCYIDSFASNLCSAETNGCTGGSCGCFITNNGASCNESNLVDPKPDPLPGNGGGCQENNCNAVAAKAGLQAGCCPVGC